MRETGSGKGEQGTRRDLDPRTPFLHPGFGVLVTRPAHQAGALARRIEEAGGRAILWPVLEILPPQDPAALEKLPDQLARADIAIFVSPNAVERCAARVGELSPTLRLGAVGQGTARALRHCFGRDTDLVPAERFDSEGLLTLAELQEPRGLNVLIVRGSGGREILAETLRARGARVEYADVYWRGCPAQAPAAAYDSLARGEVAVVTVTSAEGLGNLLRMAGPLAERLLHLPLIVVGERMAANAVESGFKVPPLIAHAGDDALIEELRAWAARGRERA